jgi:predicted PurR-regulated permease PerM
MLEKKIDISTGAIFRIVIIILGIWILYLIRDIVALFFISLILTAAIDPGVDWLRRRKIPRGVGVLIIYCILFLIIGTAIYFFIPAIISQLNDFSQSLPRYIENLSNLSSGIKNFTQAHNISLGAQDFLNLGSNTANLRGKLFSTTVGVFSGLVSFIIVLSLTFYLSVKEDGMRRFLNSVTPEKHQEYVVSLAERMKIKIGKWVLGQLLLMLIIFVFDFLALYFLKVPYALAIAIISGLLEVVPYIGPIISATLATMVGFLISPVMGLLALAVFTAIQQIEGHIIVPQVMKKAVGLNPVVVILALLIGAKLAGALGAILAVPVTAAASVFVKDLMDKNKD